MVFFLVQEIDLSDWNWLFVRLPDGLNMIIINTFTYGFGISGVLVDDLNIKPCSKFSEY